MLLTKSSQIDIKDGKGMKGIKEANQFIRETDDETHLVVKVVLILGISGACRREELTKMTIIILTLYRKYAALRQVMLPVADCFFNIKIKDVLTKFDTEDGNLRPWPKDTLEDSINNKIQISNKILDCVISGSPLRQLPPVKTDSFSNPTPISRAESDLSGLEINIGSCTGSTINVNINYAKKKINKWFKNLEYPQLWRLLIPTRHLLPGLRDILLYKCVVCFFSQATGFFILPAQTNGNGYSPNLPQLRLAHANKDYSTIRLV
ncbi:hypothetical protein NQ317_006453 [Molorchus minor]|uniref:Uncharacterized protein n=1 Tax=Molorchus minor TaxID=1323400 RepID=A0ABQ9IQG2_9CUCU|nr:hypothetical protein NQ317_006453 [Molorchus minor]